MFAAGVSAWCQPAITRLDAFVPNTASPGGAAITALSPLPAGFTLQISGTGFSVAGLQGIDWVNNTTPGGSFTFGPASVSVTSSTRMSVTVPASLFVAAANITVRVRQATGTATAAFTVNNVLYVYGTLPDGTVGAPYIQPFFSGGTAPYVVSVVDGIFPPGMTNPGTAGTVTTSNVLSGTPNTEGLYSFRLQVSDAWGDTATGTYTLNIRRAPPALSASFGAVAIPLNGTTTLSFTVANANSTIPLTGVTFGDMLPEGLVVGTPNGLNGSCGLGSIVAPSGSSFISLSGGSLPPARSCSFRVNVTATKVGVKTNMTSTVSSIEAGIGSAAGSGLTVGDVYRVQYASNLNSSDAYINITNTTNQSAAEDGSVPQDICVNVYAFAPTEQLMACCSCPVTPNGLVSLSARDDLISNTLTPVIPNSIVIGMVASNAAGASCNAANVVAPTGTATGNLATGLHAWGVTAHSVPIGGGSTLGITEMPALPAQLSAGQLNHMAWLCAFIQGNGSWYGICRSCRPGGLGAARR